MVDDSDSTHRLAFDGAPLIYLAKIEALDVMTAGGLTAYAPASVLAEATRPAIAMRHPDAVVIEEEVRRGSILSLRLDAAELAHARNIEQRVPGLHAGECEVLALALRRRMSAVIFERRARRVAQAMGAPLVDLIELLFAGTAEQELLAERIRRFARLVDMRLQDLEHLLQLVERRVP